MHVTMADPEHNSLLNYPALAFIILATILGYYTGRWVKTASPDAFRFLNRWQVAIQVPVLLIVVALPFIQRSVTVIEVGFAHYMFLGGFFAADKKFRRRRKTAVKPQSPTPR